MISPKGEGRGEGEWGMCAENGLRQIPRLSRIWQRVRSSVPRRPACELTAPKCVGFGSARFGRRAVGGRAQFQSQPEIGQAATKHHRRILRKPMAQSRHKEVLHGAVGVFDHAQLAPSGRLPEQIEQHPLGFRTCIRRLRSHGPTTYHAAAHRVETVWSSQARPSAPCPDQLSHGGPMPCP